MAVAALQMLVSELGGSIGIPDLALGDEDHCLLSIDDRLELSIEYDESADSVVLSTLVAELPADAGIDVYRGLLIGNFLWLGTGGATLSVDPGGQTVMLAYREAVAGLDLARFQQLIEGVLNNADAWRNRLGAVGTDDTEEEAEPAPEPVFTGLRV